MTKKMSALERSLQEMKDALEGKPNGVITNSVKFYPVPAYSAEDIKTLRSKLGLIQGGLCPHIGSIAPHRPSMGSWAFTP